MTVWLHSQLDLIPFQFLYLWYYQQSTHLKQGYFLYEMFKKYQKKYYRTNAMISLMPETLDLIKC